MTNGNAFALKILRSFGLIGSEQPGWLILAGVKVSAVCFLCNYVLRYLMFGYVVFWDEVVVWILLVTPVLCFAVFSLSCVSILERHVRHMAQTDGLTGIGNRRWFMQELDKRIAAGAQGMLLYVDADHFKTINDRYGHGAGNECLRSLALHLQRLATRNDLVGRIGGEEFAIFLDGAGHHSLRLLAAKACSGVVMDTVEGAPHVTCTIGVAALSRGQTREQLLQQADLAMYEAKQRGRARMVVKQGDLFHDIEGAACRGQAKRASYLPPAPSDEDMRPQLGPMGTFIERTGLFSTQTFYQRLRVFMVFMTVIYLADIFVRGVVLNDVNPARQFVTEILIGTPYVLLMQAAIGHMVWLREDLQVSADTDALTGLLNRRSFFERINDAPDGVLILVDADYFKTVNDTHGHDAGDSCLKDLATHIRGLVRRDDLVARLGGEEFAVFMPHIPVKRAFELEQQLCGGITIAPTSGAPMAITLSAGVAVIDGADDVDAALMRADLALYRAKDAGRARMCQAAA